MKQDHSKAYTWVFTDGAKITLRNDENEITAAELEYLQRLNQRDANDNRRYRRHNVSLESLAENVDKSIVFIDVHADFEDANLDRLEAQYCHARLTESLEGLSATQTHLLTQVYSEKRSLREIARLEGVSVNAIRKRLLVILRKLQKNLR
jgi:RNA polymerase sigma factor (sigma-70 family)